MTQQNNVILSSTASRKHRYEDEFKQRLTVLSNASIGVFLIRTREPYRLQQILQDWSISKKYAFKVWTILTGWQHFASPGALALGKDNDIETLDVTLPEKSDMLVDAVGALVKLHMSDDNDYPEPGCYVVMHMHHAFENPAVQQFIKAHVDYALSRFKRVIFVVPEGVDIKGWSDIENDVTLIDFKTPSHLELKDIWESCMERFLDKDRKPLEHFSDADVDYILQNATGMSHLEFETAIALAFVEFEDRLSAKPKNGKKPITPQELVREIIKTKVETIKKTESLELMTPAKMEDIGGLKVVKDWLQMRTKAFSPEARKFGVDQPKGMLVVGPPGTGKSLLAKATSAVFGIPCIKLDIGKVFGSLVGQSEAGMRRALKYVEAMAPCVLLLDEVDKGLSGMSGGGDSGTSARVFATLLTWLQERNSNESPVFIIMTANNVTGLPPEMMRRGRIDEIFAVTFPNISERKQIIKIHVERRGHKLTDEEYTLIASDNITKDFVGAELEAIIKDAITTCYYRGEKTLTAKEVVVQAKTIVPLSKSFADKVAFMNDWAKNNAKWASAPHTVDEASDVAVQAGSVKTLGNRGKMVVRKQPRRIEN